MTKYILLIAICATAIFTSCSQNEIGEEVLPTTIEVESTITNEEEPVLDLGVVEFTIDNKDTQVVEKDAVILTNNSKNAVSYLWDFGNGHTSTDANPTYKYGNHGHFPITLSITDKYGNVEEVSHDILVICLFDGRDHSDF